MLLHRAPLNLSDFTPSITVTSSTENDAERVRPITMLKEITVNATVLKSNDYILLTILNILQTGC